MGIYLLWKILFLFIVENQTIYYGKQALCGKLRLLFITKTSDYYLLRVIKTSDYYLLRVIKTSDYYL